ncbi:MAG: hypothetical protein WC872_01555 [Candidatus Absconditabacterales bacterium]
MLIVLTVILLAIFSGILISIYSNIFAFNFDLQNTINYTSAYYGAISSIQRAQLVMDNKKPGFVGSGGFFGNNKFGPQSDQFSGDFGNYTKEGNGLRWEITESRTNSIPISGGGNVPNIYSNPDSNNFNIIDQNLQTFFLSYDNTSDGNKYYTGTDNEDIIYFSGDYISGVFRLPPKISAGFVTKYLLCEHGAKNCNELDINLVPWSLIGFYNGSGFTIIPFENNWGGLSHEEGYSNYISARVINNEGGKIYFIKGTNGGYSPVWNNLSEITTHNTIPKNFFSGFMLLNPRQPSFGEIFNKGGNEITGLKLSFNVSGILYSRNNNQYPFLEYHFDFPQQIANNGYTIKGYGKVGNQIVQIIVKRGN